MIIKIKNGGCVTGSDEKCIVIKTNNAIHLYGEKNLKTSIASMYRYYENRGTINPVSTSFDSVLTYGHDNDHNRYVSISILE
jgi:anaerobic ribonucleoside-triphosphate reductase